MTDVITRDLPGFYGEAVPSAVVARRPRAGFLQRCIAWLRHRDDLAWLREMDPRMARDMGATPASDRPEAFAVDPRPLWGIGLTPQPTETSPPWSRDRRRD